jgi:hypothetical protein
MGVSHLILQTLDPKITPPNLEVQDFESADSSQQIRLADASGFAQQLGRSAPLVRIGNAKIQPGSIVGMNLYFNSLIPTMDISFIDEMGSFTSVAYPKTNPLVSVYIATDHPKLKSFSQTFLITNISSIPIGPNAKRFDITAELYVPNLNGNFIKSYRQMTSSMALRKIAEELRLGFASNEDSVNDRMTWINPNLNYKEFIKLITDHSYKNEKSFFDCFIDRYYVLNFINVEKQFRTDPEVDLGYPSFSTEALDLSRSSPNKVKLLENIQIPLILTNSLIGDSSDDLKIVSYSLVGDNGEILAKDGFRKTVFVYRHGEESPVNKWFAEPISNVSRDLTETHQSPELTDYLDNSVVKWMGIDYGNAHTNYKFAKIINSHNRLETEKNTLNITINSFNNNIIRGSRVKVNIFGTRIKAVSDDAAKDILPKPSTQYSENQGINNNAAAEIYDDRLSGFYYVKEISYHYSLIGNSSNLRFSTKMVLARRNWKPAEKMEITKR